MTESKNPKQLLIKFANAKGLGLTGSRDTREARIDSKTAKTLSLVKPFCVYILKTIKGNRSYVGKTNDMHRRYRQHIKQLTNGAHYTSCIASDNEWIPVAQIVGFTTEKQALQFEYAMKRKMARYRNTNLSKKVRNRINELYDESIICGQSRACPRVLTLLECISLPKWTSKAIDAKEVPLQIIWYGSRYRPVNLSQYIGTDNSMSHITDVIHNGITGNKVTIYHQEKKEISIRLEID